MQQPQAMQVLPVAEPKPDSPSGVAPPKQVALAMERLGHAARLIADIRIGADRFLEALLAMSSPRQTVKALEFVEKADESMRKHLQDLQSLGRQLEESGVLTQSLSARGDSWGLHMPLVCPDGAVVAYAWKRQLAGQAGASAVDRTRLALKAFTDQKKRYFPHLEDETTGQPGDTDIGNLKRHCGPQGFLDDSGDSAVLPVTLSDILFKFEKDAPNMKITTYQRLDWFKRASSLSTSSGSIDSYSKYKVGSLGMTSTDQVAIMELFVPLVFRAVVSLHPVGSMYPDAVAFFSPDEGGNYIHPRGSSIYQVFKHITEISDKALQYFLSVESEKALELLLHWIYSYETLFTKVCSQCRRLLVMDKSVNLLLPPVKRPYLQQSSAKHSAPLSGISAEGKISNSNQSAAYHISCCSEEN